MKKLLALNLMLAASAAGFAQTTLWDGENQDLGSQGGCWDDGQPTVVANEWKDGINTSEKCLKFTMTNDSKTVKIPFRNWTKPSMNGSKRISLMIRKPEGENVQIELSDPTDGSDGYWKKTVAWYDGNDEWQKVVFDFSTNGSFDCPGVISITAQTTEVTETQDVYIDNVVIEAAPRVDGKLLSEIPDGSLTGDIKLTGAWMYGQCLNVDGEWKQVVYDDFIAIRDKVGAGLTSVDMRGTVLKEPYISFKDKNRNVLIYADYDFSSGNIIADGRIKELTLSENGTFHAPEAFTADAVTVERKLQKGYNTITLPFAVTANELGADYIAAYKSNAINDGKATVSFANTAEAAAYTPLLANVTAEEDILKFNEKKIEATRETAGETFISTLTNTNVNGLWSMSEAGTFAKGGAETTINAFNAYLSLPETVNSVEIDTDNATGISGTAASEAAATADVYTLSGVRVLSGVNAKEAAKQLPKGIYIINNKKVVVR